MSNRSVRQVICAASSLAALAALFVSSSASAARMEGFQSRAGYYSDQSCIGNYWTGVINACDRTILVQAVATINSSNWNTFYPNAMAYADDDSTLQTYGVNNNLDTVWTNGPSTHGHDVRGDAMWGPYLTSPATSVPPAGALIFMVQLPPNAKIGSYSW